MHAYVQNLSCNFYVKAFSISSSVALTGREVVCFCSEDDMSGGASGLVATGLRRVSREYTLQFHAFNATACKHKHTQLYAIWQ